jgi:outer membrane immunogenic protein
MTSTSASIVGCGSSCALALLALMPGASAADLSTRTYTKVPAAVEAVSSWTGFYAGAAIGWTGSRDDWTTDLIADGTVLGTPAAIGRLGLGGPNATFNTDGVRGALFAGYNYQINQSIVTGIEADVGLATNDKATLNYIPGTVFGAPGTSTPLGDRVTISGGADASIRARLGYLITPSWLLYATGGGAFQRESIDIVCPGSTQNSRWCVADRSANVSTTHIGWTLGAGLEGKLTGSLSGRIEYRYSDLGQWNNSYFLNTNGDEVYAHTRLTSHSVMVGAAYLFGGPVVANY